MIEKRFQVFVSSTFKDLITERQEITQALLELDCIPSGMELFPAANEDQWTLIKKVIDDCDYYIVIIAGKYGSLGPDGISYTEMEYRYALDKQKPIIAFLHKDTSTLPANKTEAGISEREKLQKFRTLAQKKVVRFWENPTELGSVVSRSLVQLTKSTPAIGWVRGDNVPDESAAQEILKLRKIIDKLEKEKIERAHAAPAGASLLSQGKDKIQIECSISYYIRGDIFAQSEELSWEVLIDWDTIIAAVTPSLIDEANEGTMRARINDALFGYDYHNMKKDEILSKHHIDSTKITTKSFETCLVQLVALGVISKSTRNRSIKDKTSYWKLTDHGEMLMYKLRAIHKNTSETIQNP
ncbi:hypothetical protein PMNALOAF_0964 [Methylobacterium adhaesivum]|uniref:DUF4062 domain-containing protein n=1 Tax=Methylobacterium adhaesivum TaxID=333297 RepID=A0ABT8BH81_9HYPH|nr:DUF4062 domain-containing protein [Methylobacterium adhaesivum]MDN3590885.1 DUF4062 domain-containing protein [Methylobacterium adhaesivum]GJD29727.1 hypothetical protein PMNALOAF_0964 [Methylobacterium adhaesivum]